MPSVAEAEATLASLAGALFPDGMADFAQLVWPTAPRDGRPPEIPSGQFGSGEGEADTAELRYRILLEQIPAVTFLAVLGEGSNEIYVSPYIETLLGFTQQEWLENPFLWYSRLHPDDRDLWNTEFARGVATGGPFQAECRFIARDGRIVWVRGDARLVKDDLGRPMFLQGVAFDITESKRTHTRELQEAVRSTEQRYRDLVEHLDAIFWEANADTGELTFVSRAAETILGFPVDRWLSESDFWLRQVHPEDRPGTAELWAGLLDTGGEQEFEFRALRADGSEIWLHTRMRAPSLDTRGRYVFGVMLDVTERKRSDEERARLLEIAQEARETAENANRAKDEFLATLSHELKTPLNALIGYAQLLRADQMPPELVGSALESIERNAHAQARLVEDLLDVSRLMTGKLHLEVTPVNLVTVLDAAIDTVRLAAEAKRIGIKLYVDVTELVVWGDPSRLQQVVWNLLSNAVKFTPEKGQIEVRLESDGEQAHIRVSDNGPGIAPEFLPHVFERFRQADNSMTRRQGGLGLGLAIVRQIVEIHGGSISVESSGAGQGTTFVVTLPLMEAPEKPAVRGVQPGKAEALEGMRVLVVDDDMDSRDLLRLVFSRAGAEVTLATSAAEAVQALDQVEVDVVVCDIGMPDEDGYRLLRRLRDAGLDAERLPAVALTAFTGADHERRALQAGFQEYVAKPVDVVSIVDTVARVARGASGVSSE